MLFNSPQFLLVFLPAALLFVALAKRAMGAAAGMAVLILASLFFYGWWNVWALAVIGASIAVNYCFATALSNSQRKFRFPIMWLGIALNIAALGYFKYTNFILSMFAWKPLSIILPLAISFYTFQQIVFLVDIYNGRMRHPSFREYLVSVLFFPHLIAGPLIHYTDIMRQFHVRFAITTQTIATGLPIFCVGLVKKVAIADNLGTITAPLFHRAVNGPLEFFSAWAAALSYTAQIYFDFSGYSDMAIGLGLMFGIMLPLNFDSPYKSTSIIEFWRRWHMTLSAFLRDYLYIPLGGSRAGHFRRYVNLLLVMLIGGLWHGAGWTFVFWGFLHGSYLCINHIWREVIKIRPRYAGRIGSAAGATLTFAAILVAWVFFRASSFAAASSVLTGMAGGSFVSLPGEIGYYLSTSTGHLWRIPLDGRGLSLVEFASAGVLIPIAYFIIFALPNTAELFALKTGVLEGLQPYLRSELGWRAAVVAGLCLWVAAFGVLGAAPSEFIYFQF
jgi:alginate O-acetyltransferase complex protein AlgI